MERHAAVLRLQTVGNVLLHLLTTPQEPAAIPSKLLPGPPPVLLLLSTDEDLLHMFSETNLKVRAQSRGRPRSPAALLTPLPATCSKPTPIEPLVNLDITMPTHSPFLLFNITPDKCLCRAAAVWDSVFSS